MNEWAAKDSADRFLTQPRCGEGDAFVDTAVAETWLESLNVLTGAERRLAVWLGRPLQCGCGPPPGPMSDIDAHLPGD